MGLPKRQHSHARTRQKRAHLALSVPRYVVCAKCEAPLMPHNVCRKCGSYQGRQVLKIRERKSKPGERRR